MLAAIADKAILVAVEVDRQRNAAARDVGRLGCDQHIGVVKIAQLSFRQHRMSGAEADL